MGPPASLPGWSNKAKAAVAIVLLRRSVHFSELSAAFDELDGLPLARLCNEPPVSNFSAFLHNRLPLHTDLLRTPPAPSFPPPSFDLPPFSLPPRYEAAVRPAATSCPLTTSSSAPLPDVPALPVLSSRNDSLDTAFDKIMSKRESRLVTFENETGRLQKLLGSSSPSPAPCVSDSAAQDSTFTTDSATSPGLPVARVPGRACQTKVVIYSVDAQTDRNTYRNKLLQNDAKDLTDQSCQADTLPATSRSSYSSRTASSGAPDGGAPCFDAKSQTSKVMVLQRPFIVDLFKCLQRASCSFVARWESDFCRIGLKFLDPDRNALCHVEKFLAAFVLRTACGSADPAGDAFKPTAQKNLKCVPKKTDSQRDQSGHVAALPGLAVQEHPERGPRRS